MKNILTNLTMAVALLCTAGGALEAQSFRVYATVPFGWQANGHTLRAGEYLITKEGSSPVVAVQATRDNKKTFLMIGPGSGTNSSSRLVFHQYGDQYFLSEVWVPGSTGGKLVVGKAEKEAMESETPRTVATIVVGVRPAL